MKRRGGFVAAQVLCQPHCPQPLPSSPPQEGRQLLQQPTGQLLTHSLADVLSSLLAAVDTLTNK